MTISPNTMSVATGMSMLGIDFTFIPRSGCHWPGVTRRVAALALIAFTHGVLLIRAQTQAHVE